MKMYHYFKAKEEVEMYQVFSKTTKGRKWEVYSRPFATELEAFNCLQEATNRRTVGKDGHFIMYFIREV